MTESRNQWWERIFDSAGDDFRLFEWRCLQNYAKLKKCGSPCLRSYDGWQHLAKSTEKVAAIFDAPTWREKMVGHLLAGETGQALAVLFAIVRGETPNADYPKMSDTLIINAEELRGKELQDGSAMRDLVKGARHIYYFGKVAWSNRVEAKGCAITCCRHLSLRSLNSVRLPPQTEFAYRVPERLYRLARIICANDVSTMEKFNQAFKDENEKVMGGKKCHF